MFNCLNPGYPKGAFKKQHQLGIKLEMMSWKRICYSGILNPENSSSS